MRNTTLSLAWSGEEGFYLVNAEKFDLVIDSHHQPLKNSILQIDLLQLFDVDVPHYSYRSASIGLS